MSHISGKEKVILYGTLWFAVCVAMLLGIVWPLYLRLQNFPERYEGLRYRLEGLEIAVEKFSSTKKEFEHINKNIELIRSRFLDPQQAVVFIEALERLSRDEQLYQEISLVSEPMPSGEGAAKSSFVFSLTVIGTFEHLMKFIAHLENFLYAIDVERVSFSPTKEGQIYGLTPNSQKPASFKASPGDIASNIRIRVYAIP